MRRYVVEAALFAVAITCSCRKELPSAPDCDPRAETVELSVGCVSDEATRSSALDGMPDDRICNANVFAYRKGLLEAEAYSPDGSAVSLTLIKGCRYRIYAIANVGKYDAPVREDDLCARRLKLSSPADFSGGLPMSGIPSSEYVAEKSGNLRIPLVRLVAKYSVCIDKDLQRCAFQVTGLRLKQAAADVTPFLYDGSASTVADGDCASLGDLAALNSGGRVDFYVPENCCGVLLQGNDDPWKKTPDRIPDAKDWCTYLELDCDWQTDGATAEMGLRMYLGCDNCSDFNVRRGVNAMLTLYLSDLSTVHKSSWKVSLEYTSESRSVWFWEEENRIYQGDGWTELEVTMRPYSSCFNVSADAEALEAAQMELKIENGAVWAKSEYDGDGYPTVRVKLETWDHAVSDSAYVKVMFYPGDYRYCSSSVPSYAGQYGYVQVGDMSPERPARITLRDKVWTFTGQAAPLEHYVDPVSGNGYWADYAEGRLYVKAAGLAEDRLVATRWKDRKIVTLPKVPEPKVLFEDFRLSEGGNLMYDARKSVYYDYAMDVRLYSAAGSELPLSDFAVPDGLLRAKGMTVTDANRYSEVMERYTDGLEVGISNADYLTGYIESDGLSDNCNLIKNENSLHRYYWFGLGSFARNRIDATLTVSGAFPTQTVTVSLLKAFPSQRHLGACYNRRIAFGLSASGSANIDMTSRGLYQAPFGNIVWDVRHSSFDVGDEPSAAYAYGKLDDYVEAMSFSNGNVSFGEPNPQSFPSCGGVAIHGRIINPHNGTVIDGYYTADVILEFSIGVTVDFYPVTGAHSGQLGYSFVPLNAYSTYPNAQMWNAHFFQESIVQCSYPFRASYYTVVSAPVRIPASAEDHSLYLTVGDAPPSTSGKTQRSGYLKGYIDCFHPMVMNSTSTLDLTRSTLPGTSLDTYSKGQRGFYRIIHEWVGHNDNLAHCVLGY